jgi:hypothetical protein
MLISILASVYGKVESGSVSVGVWSPAKGVKTLIWYTTTTDAPWHQYLFSMSHFTLL